MQFCAKNTSCGNGLTGADGPMRTFALSQPCATDGMLPDVQHTTEIFCAQAASRR